MPTGGLLRLKLLRFGVAGPGCGWLRPGAQPAGGIDELEPGLEPGAQALAHVQPSRR